MFAAEFLQMDKVYYYMRERGFYYMRQRGLLLHARERFTTTCERCWRCTLVRKKRLSSTRIQKKYDKAIYYHEKDWFMYQVYFVVFMCRCSSCRLHYYTHNTRTHTHTQHYAHMNRMRYKQVYSSAMTYGDHLQPDPQAIRVTSHAHIDSLDL